MGLATAGAEARVDAGNNPRDDGGMAATRTTDYAVRALVALALEGGERKSKKSLCPRFGFGHARKIYGAGDAVVKAGWICGEP